MNNKIWAVVKDTGGTKGVLPVVAELRAMGRSVQVIANGIACDQVRNDPRAAGYITAATAQEVLDKLGEPPAVLITSMCSGGGVGRDLVPLLRPHGTKVAAAQDYYGAEMLRVWADSQFRPDYLWVNDEVGQRIAMRAWPGFCANNIWITGYPAFDRFAHAEPAHQSTGWSRRVTCRILGVPVNCPFVLFLGEKEHTAHAAGELVAVLNGLDRPVTLIPRLHPAMKERAPQEVEPTQAALREFKNGIMVEDSSVMETDGLIRAADMVVSMSSTGLLEAAACRRMAVSIFYPGRGAERFRQITGTLSSGEPLIPELPEVELGCCAKATNRTELAAVTARLVQGPNAMMLATQMKHFKTDGLNARRAAALVAGLLRQ